MCDILPPACDGGKDVCFKKRLFVFGSVGTIKNENIRKYAPKDVWLIRSLHTWGNQYNCTILHDRIRSIKYNLYVIIMDMQPKLQCYGHGLKIIVKKKRINCQKIQILT